LAEIACGNFSGHRARPLAKSVVFASCAGGADIGLDRWQKAWFLPAALAERTSGLDRMRRTLRRSGGIFPID